MVQPSCKENRKSVFAKAESTASRTAGCKATFSAGHVEVRFPSDEVRTIAEAIMQSITPISAEIPSQGTCRIMPVFHGLPDCNG